MWSEDAKTYTVDNEQVLTPQALQAIFSEASENGVKNFDIAVGCEYEDVPTEIILKRREIMLNNSGTMIRLVGNSHR